jgi:hypothetical protein
MYPIIEMKTMQSLKYWQRFASNGLPIYVHPQKPDWFVAGNKADILLRRAMAADFASACHGPVAHGEEDVLDRAQIFSHLTNSEAAAYCGRENFLKLSSLKECWFHLTNQCNLSCRHCLFSASPTRSRSLSREQRQNLLAARFFILPAENHLSTHNFRKLFKIFSRTVKCMPWF